METCRNVGFELWQARQARGLSRAQASARIKLRLGQIEALESNDIGAFPPAYLRGHVRAYAAELGLDPDDVAGRYLAQFGIATSSARTAGSPAPSITSLTSLLRFRVSIARAAMVAVLMVVGLLFMHSPGKPRGVSSVAASAPPALEAPPAYAAPGKSSSFVAVAARSKSITHAHLGW
jgi:cytoskeletal protein RodZ